MFGSFDIWICVVPTLIKILNKKSGISLNLSITNVKLWFSWVGTSITLKFSTRRMIVADDFYYWSSTWVSDDMDFWLNWEWLIVSIARFGAWFTPIHLCRWLDVTQPDGASSLVVSYGWNLFRTRVSAIYRQYILSVIERDCETAKIVREYWEWFLKNIEEACSSRS